MKRAPDDQLDNLLWFCSIICQVENYWITQSNVVEMEVCGGDDEGNVQVLSTSRLQSTSLVNGELESHRTMC